jgi:hypothetical protein
MIYFVYKSTEAVLETAKKRSFERFFLFPPNILGGPKQGVLRKDDISVKRPFYMWCCYGL